jgi:UDP-N-acetylglucosamine 4,6-dehydratase (inverting)
MKQWEMMQRFKNDKRISFVIGDVRDKERLYRCMDGINYVVHAAATKIVPTAEYNPFETIKTNVLGAMNVIEAAIDSSIEKVVALSTDKASNPINLYGASKLAADKLFVAANNSELKNKTKFSIVRYGNVMGSRGSIIPFFLSLRDQKTLPITDKAMTRFMITLDQAIGLVNHTFSDMLGGEIYVKKIPTMKVVDIAKAINSKAKLEVIGIRPGEKIHEQMIGIDDAYCTYEYKDYYKILPAINNWDIDKKRIKNGKKVPNGFIYGSDNKDDLLSENELKKWLKTYKKQI